jgi:hypothetical protein
VGLIFIFEILRSTLIVSKLYAQIYFFSIFHPKVIIFYFLIFLQILSYEFHFTDLLYLNIFLK